MRPYLAGYGVIVLLTAGVMTYYAWDNAIVRADKQQAFEQITHGMTLAEVDAIMGSKGQFSTIESVCGGKFRPQVETRYRWEDAYRNAHVTFYGYASGDKSDVVIHFRIESKTTPESGELWLERLYLLAVAILGIAFFIVGVRPRKRRPA